jgi:hypothetical protein
MKSERLFGGGSDSSTKIINNIHFIVKSAEDEVLIVGMSSGSRIFDLKINFRSFKWELNYIPRIAPVSFSKEHFVFLERAVLKECLYRNVHFSMVDILFELMRMNLESQKDVQRAGSILLLV